MLFRVLVSVRSQCLGRNQVVAVPRRNARTAIPRSSMPTPHGLIFIYLLWDCLAQGIKTRLSCCLSFLSSKQNFFLVDCCVARREEREASSPRRRPPTPTIVSNWLALASKEIVGVFLSFCLVVHEIYLGWKVWVALWVVAKSLRGPMAFSKIASTLATPVGLE